MGNSWRASASDRFMKAFEQEIKETNPVSEGDTLTVVAVGATFSEYDGQVRRFIQFEDGFRVIIDEVLFDPSRPSEFESDSVAHQFGMDRDEVERRVEEFDL